MSDSAVEANNNDVKILSKGVGKWKVMIQLSLDQFKDRNGLFKKINAVKKQLAQEIELPPQFLEFGEITDRKEKNGELTVTLDIFKKAIENGPLSLNLLPATSDYGIEFPEMAATLDLYAFDPLGSLLTEEKIVNLLKKRKLEFKYVQSNVIQDALHKVLNNPTPILELEVARGEYPDPGRNAQLIFPAFEKLTLDEIIKNIDDRRVKQCDVLVQKIPPQRGVKDGTNVKGERLPSPWGKDIKIEAGRGAIINLDKTKITAQIDGLMMIDIVNQDTKPRRTSYLDQPVDATVHVKVNPLRIINGNETIDICTNSSIEVQGNVGGKSKIICSSEIIINGNVEEDAILESKGNIHIRGSAKGSAITSHNNILISGSVSEGEITAGGKVSIDNIVTDSQIIGREVELKGLRGGKVIAKKKAVLGKIEADKDGEEPLIRIGAEDFHHNKVQENEKFITFGHVNLNEMRKFFSDYIVEAVNSGNIKAMFIRHVRDMRLKSKINYTKKQAESILKLLDSTSSIRELLNEKSAENSQLSKQIREALGALKELVILEGCSGACKAKLGSQVIEIPAVDKPVKYTQIGEEEIKEEEI